MPTFGQLTYDLAAVVDVQVDIDGGIIQTDGGHPLIIENNGVDAAQGAGLSFSLAGLPHGVEVTSATLLLDVILAESTQMSGGAVTYPEFVALIGGGGFDPAFDAGTFIQVVHPIGSDPIEDVGRFEMDLDLSTPALAPHANFGEMLETLILVAQSTDPYLEIFLDSPFARPNLTVGVVSTEGAVTGAFIAPTLRLTFVPEPSSAMIGAAFLAISLPMRGRCRRSK